jgi:hypothetical protein
MNQQFLNHVMNNIKHICCILLFSCCLSCENKHDKVFQSETDEHFSLIKEWITELPEVPVYFYWEDVRIPFGDNTPVASCLTTKVRFEKPYIIANGVKFHAYYWVATQNDTDRNLKIVSGKIAFTHEK